MGGQHFDLYTDIQALKWILSGSDTFGRLTRSRLRLLELDFTVHYKKGAKNTVTNAISRLPTSGEAELAPDTEIPCLFLKEDFKNRQQASHPPPEVEEAGWASIWSHLTSDYAYAFAVDEASAIPVCLYDPFDKSHDEVDDEELFPLFDTVYKTEAKDLSPLTHEKILSAQAEGNFCREFQTRIEAGEEKTFFEDERSYLCRRSGPDNITQIILPEVLRQRAQLLAHYPRTAVHPGGSRMYQTLRRTFHCPSLGLDAYNTFMQCASCAKERISLRKHASLLKLYPAETPWTSSPSILSALYRGRRWVTDTCCSLLTGIPSCSRTSHCVVSLHSK